jgi:hypothetical protein
METNATQRRLAVALLASLALSACAAEPGTQLAQAGGTPPAATSRQSADDDVLRAEQRRRLAAALTADDAVVLALIGNRGLRTTYYGAGMLDSDLVRGLDAMAEGSGDIERRFVLATIGQRSYALASEVGRRKGDELKLQVATEQLRPRRRFAKPMPPPWRRSRSPRTRSRPAPRPRRRWISHVAARASATGPSSMSCASR